MVTCPVCRSRTVRRSVRRNIIERLRSFAGVYPYRCYDCQTRFFALREPRQTPENPRDEIVADDRQRMDEEERD